MATSYNFSAQNINYFVQQKPEEAAVRDRGRQDVPVMEGEVLTPELGRADEQARSRQRAAYSIGGG